MRFYHLSERRPSLTLGAVAASGVAAAIYYLIGFKLVQVVTDAPAGSDIRGFGVTAGSSFLLLAILLLTVESRVLWVLAAVLQVGVLAMYLAVAPQRDPPFEAWGLLIQACQLVVLACVVWLLIRRSAKLHSVPSRDQARSQLEAR